jgi:hypothetical protein
MVADYRACRSSAAATISRNLDALLEGARRGFRAGHPDARRGIA